MKKLVSPLASIICVVLVLVSFPISPLGCTTFCLVGKGEVLFGRNYDWIIGDGLVMINKRGVVKTATVVESNNVAKWVSKYGSVTFNQYGRENPAGGMNEAGLVVEQLWLDETEYPHADARPALGTQEWVQYLLDTSGTTSEAIRNGGAVRIESDVKVHYLISDKAGNAATLEFIKGQLIVHTGANLPIPALTNNTYDDSRNFASHADATKTITNDSFDRFVRATKNTEEFEKHPLTGEQAIKYAFEVLSDAAQKNPTKDPSQWTAVYDQKRGRIYFRTLQSPQIKWVDMKAFDYACGTTVKIFDVNSTESGDVTAKFTDYTRKANRDLIERSFNGTDFLKPIPPTIRTYLSSYPESFKCQH